MILLLLNVHAVLNNSWLGGWVGHEVSWLMDETYTSMVRMNPLGSLEVCYMSLQLTFIDHILKHDLLRLNLMIYQPLISFVLLLSLQWLM